jgi:hypothetical protein
MNFLVRIQLPENNILELRRGMGYNEVEDKLKKENVIVLTENSEQVIELTNSGYTVYSLMFTDGIYIEKIDITDEVIHMNGIGFQPTLENIYIALK